MQGPVNGTINGPTAPVPNASASGGVFGGTNGNGTAPPGTAGTVTQPGAPNSGQNGVSPTGSTNGARNGVAGVGPGPGGYIGTPASGGNATTGSTTGSTQSAAPGSTPSGTSAAPGGNAGTQGSVGNSDGRPTGFANSVSKREEAAGVAPSPSTKREEQATLNQLNNKLQQNVPQSTNVR
jgi:hypothetical protein